MAKKDPIKELYSQLQTMRKQPDTAKRPNKWRALYQRDLGAMLTRYMKAAKENENLKARLNAIAN